jgi:VWFA-related protein
VRTKDLTVFLGVLLLSGARLESQESSTPVLIPGVETGVVYVDVVATDRSKQPVRDLARDDLEVREDGRPVDITHFLAPGSATADPTAPGSPREGPGGSGNQPLSVVLFVDDNQMVPVHRNSVLQALERFVRDRLTPEDRVMVVRHDTGLKVMSAFSHDLEGVETELKSLEKVSASGAVREIQRRTLIDDFGRVDTSDKSADEERKELRYRIETQSEVEYGAARRSLLALQQVVGFLAGIPGRKACLYAADGLSRRPGEDLYRQFLSRLGERAGIDNLDAIAEGNLKSVGKEIDDLVSHANGARVTFYTINASWVEFDVSGEDPSHQEMGDQAIHSGDPVDTDAQQRALQEPLIHIAESTGGLALRDNTALSKQLDRIGTDFTGGYVLGYRPQHNRDGRFHRISVSTHRKGVSLRFREGYKDKSEDEEAGDRVLAALTAEAPNPWGIRLDSRKQLTDKTGSTVVVVLVEIPFQAVRFENRGDTQWGHVHLFVAAQDEQGMTSEVQSRDVPFRIPRERLQNIATGALGYPLALALGSGPHKVALVARDDVGGTESAATLNVTVAKTP